MFMSLVNQNKSSDVISAAEILPCTDVHVLISMVSHISETKKTRANIVFVGIFCTFVFGVFFNLFFFFVFPKFQISKICLHFITYHTN